MITQNRLPLLKWLMWLWRRNNAGLIAENKSLAENNWILERYCEHLQCRVVDLKGLLPNNQNKPKNNVVKLVVNNDE